MAPFKPARPSELPTADELAEENPVDEAAAIAAADAWRDDPPDPEFELLLDAEEVED